MVNVYAWPPVGFRSFEWSITDPVSTSRSLWSGRRYVSVAQRRRRVATISVSAGTTYGVGYMEALKRLLIGGVHLVRLSSFPLNADDPPLGDDIRRSEPIEWFTNGDLLAWQSGTGPAPLRWFPTPPVFATAQSGVGEAIAWIDVPGFPPGELAAMPGEFVTVFTGTPEVREVFMVLSPAIADADGIARIRLDGRPSGTGRVQIGTEESAAFEPLEIPRSPRVVNQDWWYDWSFAEVFESETDGFVEIDPWS